MMGEDQEARDIIGGDGAPLDEATIDFLETQIPAQARAATQAAFWNALTRGYSVVIAQGDELREISPDGSQRVLKKIEPLIQLPEGLDITL